MYRDSFRPCCSRQMVNVIASNLLTVEITHDDDSHYIYLRFFNFMVFGFTAMELRLYGRHTTASHECSTHSYSFVRSLVSV